jgi:predicted XRE-type DNA-binding protein
MGESGRKPLFFVGSSQRDLQAMPEDVKDVFGSGGGQGSRAATIRRSDMSDDLKVHESSGNVFQDLDARQAEERLAKAELARVIRREIRGRKLTQTQAAELLGITQPDVSDLVRGKLGRFSMERLERFLNALDMEVRIQVGPKPKDKERAGISVELVGSF